MRRDDGGDAIRLPVGLGREKKITHKFLEPLIRPVDELAIWRALVTSAGWQRLEVDIREQIFDQVGQVIGEDKVLEGMARVIRRPYDRIAKLEADMKRTGE